MGGGGGRGGRRGFARGAGMRRKRRAGRAEPGEFKLGFLWLLEFEFLWLLEFRISTTPRGDGAEAPAGRAERGETQGTHARFRAFVRVLVALACLEAIHARGPRRTHAARWLGGGGSYTYIYI